MRARSRKNKAISLAGLDEAAKTAVEAVTGADPGAPRRYGSGKVSCLTHFAGRNEIAARRGAGAHGSIRGKIRAGVEIVLAESGEKLAGNPRWISSTCRRVELDSRVAGSTNDLHFAIRNPNF